MYRQKREGNPNKTLIKSQENKRGRKKTYKNKYKTKWQYVHTYQ